MVRVRVMGMYAISNMRPWSMKLCVGVRAMVRAMLMVRVTVRVTVTVRVNVKCMPSQI